MANGLTWLGAAGLGGALVYLFDPARGGRRRALIRDQATRALNKLDDGIDVTVEDLSHRGRGAAAEARSLVRERLLREMVPDVVLAERVRATLGRVASHAGSIEVSADQGRVTLRGLVLAREVDVQLSYHPPAGAVGHAVAAFFGSDPKTAMGEDLLRFKSLIEEGKATVRGHTATRDEVAA